ncbi:FimV/HubP family polar landmark protein [Hydrogenophaga taeniospiralis]|uniref:FimV/HubP family polar landmark protein n=1 Tax=Hydrogenophaga taeniospiralis TaxID=65656 RepID=UPI001FE1705E|nr:FimV/HubP family polar landmark protein [Hydrogenophaga taeniospiralis]
MLCISLTQHGDAQALALGRIVVQSALGEPLRAEIDVPEISAEEAASLRVGLAPGDAFRAAGMEFNPALSDLRVSLERRPDGRSFLRLSGGRPVNEPFMDMILEANWASGRIVRDYTLLFDPPNLRPAAAAPLAPGVSAQPRPSQVPPPSARPVVPPAAVGAAPSGQPPAAAPASPPAQAARPAPAPATPSPAPASEPSGETQVRVQPGDTAGRLAADHRPANVSLDQMLVAMLRANPKAFIGNNVNRIKAGAVLDMPAEATASAVPANEARQIIAAQSRDFNEFRRRLAGTVPDADVGTADRQDTGRVQAEVEDKKPEAPTQDKLTLSKGATPAQTAKEDAIAQERQAKEASTRVAELSRNIEELGKLSPAAPAAPAASPSSPAAAPAQPAPDAGAITAPAPVAAEPSAPEAPAPTTEPAPAPVPAPAPAASKPPPPAPAPAVEEPSFVDQLLDNPFVLPGAGALLALLAGLGFYRMRQRKKSVGVDSSFLESRLQPDSFFGSSGGQRIDTAEATASGSSMVYSPSQLDAAGDVDPVAEADVYLAYGRDLQAEEILKEAMRSAPTRVAIHNKLLEIYAKRRDAKAFEVVATEAYGLTQGIGSEWEHACELGKELDPNNPLYQPGGSPVVKGGGSAGGSSNNTIPFASSTLTQQDGPGADLNTDLDLDLDLDLDASQGVPSSLAMLQATPPAAQPSEAMSALDDLNETEALTRSVEDKAGPSSMSMDFDLDFPSEPAPLTRATAAPTANNGAQMPSKNEVSAFDDNEILPDFGSDEPQKPATVPRAATAPAAPEMLSFDLNEITLDLDDAPNTAPSELGALTEENPLVTKLSLAEEFRAIGDLEGARSLAEEVLAEASGTLKNKASTFLADLT